jgi:hypothetical protein
MNLSSSTSLRLNIGIPPACHEVMNTSLKLGFELGNGSNVWGTDVTRVRLPLYSDDPFAGDQRPSFTIPIVRGTNGKLVRGSWESEKGTGKSTAGSPEVHCCARGFGKLQFKWAPYDVSGGSQTDQLSAEKALGEVSEWITTSRGENNCFGSCEANHVTGSTAEDCHRSKEALGAGTSAEEEGGVEIWTGGETDSSNRRRLFG